MGSFPVGVNLCLHPQATDVIVTGERSVMANCTYCGEKIGWFADRHDRHDACFAQYLSAAAAVSNGVTETIKQHNNEALVQFKSLLQSVNKPASVSFSDLCIMALGDWQRAVDGFCYTDRTALELSAEQIAFLILFVQTIFSWLEPLPPNSRELIARYHEQIMSLQVGDVIRRICLGEGVDRLAMGDPRVDSINYLAGEFPVMVVENVRIETAQTSYVRNYGGPSFRVAPGLYWRIGQSQGQARTSLVVDPQAGHLILTNMGIYYSNAATASYISCSQILQRVMWCPASDFSPKSAMGMILNLRSGKLLGFLMGSAHQSLCFVKLVGLAEAGLIHAKKH